MENGKSQSLICDYFFVIIFCTKIEKVNLNNLEFIIYDGINFPFEDHSFDLVVTRYVLYHSFDSEICFPKKKSVSEGFEEILTRHEKSMIDSYRLRQTEDEIWATEQVNNLLFQKK